MTIYHLSTRCCSDRRFTDFFGTDGLLAEAAAGSLYFLWAFGLTVADRGLV